MTTEAVKPVRIVDEMRNSYLDYAMSVIVSRALPDVRDGLKLFRDESSTPWMSWLCGRAPHTKRAPV